MTTRHLTASMVVIDPDRGTVLLVWHRATAKLLFPGGHLDADEDPAHTAVREVVEETGVRPRLVNTDPNIPLPGMVQCDAPWLIYEIPAPAKPDRGPGRPAEPEHSHIDCLYIGTADSTLPLCDEQAGTTGPGWYTLAMVEALAERDEVRAEVPKIARRALEVIQTTTTERTPDAR